MRTPSGRIWSLNSTQSVSSKARIRTQVRLISKLVLLNPLQYCLLIRSYFFKCTVQLFEVYLSCTDITTHQLCNIFITNEKPCIFQPSIPNPTILPSLDNPQLTVCQQICLYCNSHKWNHTIFCDWLFSFSRIFKTFSEQFQAQSKIKQKVQNFPIYLFSPHMHSLSHSQHSPPPTPVVHLLQMVNLHCHITITQSLQLPEGSVLVVYILWIWINVQDIYPSLQYHTEYFHCRKILCASPMHPSLIAPKPWQPLIFSLSS